jgi:steroid delta-isomerase
MSSPEIVRFREMYDSFSEAWIDRLEELYAPGFQFQDPFHAVVGDFTKLRAYYRRALTGPASTQFITEDDATSADGTYVRWRWEYKLRAKDQLRIVPGVTHLRFVTTDQPGLRQISYHRDLFDAAEGFYEALPVLGAALRAVKKRI